MSLPSNISFFMSRLQGVSVSHFKIFPETNQTADANKIIRFSLPSNSLVNLKSLRMAFSAGMTSNGGRLPNKIDSLISRISIFCGGVLIANNFDNYHVLRHAKDALCGSKNDAATSHPEIVRRKSYHNGLGADNAVLSAANAAEDYRASANKSGSNDQFVIDFWESFLGTVEPSIVDLGLLPQLTVEITLAENNVCPCVENVNLSTTGANNFCNVNAASPIYQLTNINMQVEVLGLSSSVLDSIIQQRLSSVGYLSLPFKNYFSFQNLHTGNTKINVNSASLDRLWITYRSSTYANKGAPHAVPGYKLAGAVTAIGGDGATAGQIGDAPAALANIAQDIGRPTYDVGGTAGLNNNCEKYISKYFQFSHLPTGADAAAKLLTETDFVLQVNGASIPAYKLNPSEFYALSKNSVDHYDVNHSLTMNQYLDSYFVQCMRFCMPDSDFGRLASGLDTRSVAANITLETKNLDNPVVNIFAEVTSELRAGVGRAIEVVQ